MTTTTPPREVFALADFGGIAPRVTVVSHGDATSTEIRRAAVAAWPLRTNLEWIETEETGPDEFVSVFAPIIS